MFDYLWIIELIGYGGPEGSLPKPHYKGVYEVIAPNLPRYCLKFTMHVPLLGGKDGRKCATWFAHQSAPNGVLSLVY